MLLETDIEIQGYEGTWDIEFTDTGLFKCTNEDNVLFYRLNKLPQQLTAYEQNEILTYRLGPNYDSNELVYLSDIFMHGEHIDQITQGTY